MALDRRKRGNNSMIDDNTVGIISTVGFPIAMCLFLLYERKQTMDELKAIVSSNTSATRELMLLIKERLK